jgi:hypothetical protein
MPASHGDEYVSSVRAGKAHLAVAASRHASICAIQIFHS